MRADALQLARHHVVFRVPDPNFVLRASEALDGFKILLNGRAVYSGRAVVVNVVNTGAGSTCEATLDAQFFDMTGLPAALDAVRLQAAFNEFTRQSENNWKIQPDFKVLLADMTSYLFDLRLWLEQVELSLADKDSPDRPERERQVLTQLRPSIISSLNALFEKFELMAAQVANEDKPAHRVYVRRRLHPLVLGAPFAHRTFHKPLGYAGDYEMVNMILRDPFDGDSLFSKSLNAWFISQPPAEAHRNRIDYLTRLLVRETARVAAQNRRASVFNLGCGPATEVQRFLADHAVSDHADLLLLDFNDETLAHATNVLENLRRRHQRGTRLQMLKKSVVQILKGRNKPGADAAEARHDFIYCAGLFDYLPDKLCKQLMNIFYGMLAPDGLLVATNVDDYNPIQQMLDYVLDWRLVYRNGRQLQALAPDEADPEKVVVHADVTSVNIYLEVRKQAS